MRGISKVGAMRGIRIQFSSMQTGVQKVFWMMILHSVWMLQIMAILDDLSTTSTLLIQLSLWNFKESPLPFRVVYLFPVITWNYFDFWCRCHGGNLIEIPVEVETADHHYYHV